MQYSLNDVYDMLNFRPFKLNGCMYVIEIMCPPDHEQWWSSASFHTVVYARLCNLSTPENLYAWVIFKFAKTLNGASQNDMPEVLTLTTCQRKKMHHQYALLERYCREFNELNCYTYKVKVNKRWIINMDGIKLWMEDYLPQFQKFFGHGRSQAQRMVTTMSPTLSLLQYFIYQKSETKHTVIDLQGTRIISMYVLCDVEFTDTLVSNDMNLYKLNYLQSSSFQTSKTTAIQYCHDFEANDESSQLTSPDDQHDDITNQPTIVDTLASSAWFSQFETMK